MIKSRHRRAYKEGDFESIPLDILQEIEAEEANKLDEEPDVIQLEDEVFDDE